MEELNDYEEMWDENPHWTQEADGPEEVSMQEMYEALSPWCTKNMQEEQEKDADCRQMRDWVAQGEKPEPAELDGQSQELRRMVVT